MKALIWTFVLAGGLVWSGAAAPATPPPPEDVPAVSAYVELVPTSRGSRRAGTGATGKAKLPPKVKQKLVREGGSDAPLLEKVATGREYGAPPRSRSDRRAGTPKPAVKQPRPPSDETPVGAGVRVVTSGGNDRVALLGAFLLGLTAILAGTALYRRSASAAS